MLRFIFNFILFGFIFYLISVYLPEQFNTLVSWVATGVDLVTDLVAWIADQINAFLASRKG